MVKDLTRRSSLDPVYDGPYRVLHKTQDGSHWLLDTEGTIYQLAVIPSMLKVVSKDFAHDATYVVEKILGHRGSPGRRQYLVRSKSFRKDHD